MSKRKPDHITQEAWDAVDSPPLSTEFIQRMRPVGADHPGVVAQRRLRGPQKAPTKELVSIRLDPDVLEAFRATGAGWQRRMNDALRKAAGL